MLSLYQRLIVGVILLLAIVLGLALTLRAFVHRSANLAAQIDNSTHVQQALSSLQPFLAREQATVSRLAAAPSPEASQLAELAGELRSAQQQFRTTAFAVANSDPTVSMKPLQQEHNALAAAVNRAGSSSIRPEQLHALATTQLQPRLARLEQDVQQLLTTQDGKRAAAVAEADRYRARSIGRATVLAILSFLAAVIVASATVLSIVVPLRQTARAAQRIGQGDLQARIEWRSHDDLGTIATEVNRMAVRLRDLRETESGRRQMEHQLSDAVLQSIFEPVIVTDAKGHVLKLNQASVELLGDAAADRMALTNTPGGLRILDAVRDAVSMQRPVAQEGEAALLPMRIGKAQRNYRLRATPMRDAEGKLLGAVTVLEDVTEMQEVDRFKTRFIAVASQKLREPLKTLRLGLYTLSRGFGGELRPLQAELIHGAEEEAERLNDLMSDLIEVAELDTGGRVVKQERLRPFDILQDAYNRVSEDARAKQIEVLIRAFPDLSYVMGDRRALHSIFDNLLSNAIRHTPPEGQIVLEAVEIKDRVQFFVRDSGRGIEAERLPTIFGRFNAASVEGTGLGLSLVRRLVESLDGQVAVESRLGHGTTFSFTLPVAVALPTRHPVEIG
jgi:signal transduction histidine kinase